MSHASVNVTRSSQGLTWKHICALAVVGVILSITRQNFHFGVLNNVFHIPIVLKLFNLEEFFQDPFYQSLRSFTSLVWPALALIATPANVAAAFLVAHIISRLLLYLACMQCLIQMGVRSFLSLAAFILVLASGPAFVGYSMISETGLQIDYFTHTELTYPFIIFSMILASQGRFLWAFAVNGVTFNVNAFVGVWLVVILAIMVVAEPASIQRKVRNLAAGGALQAIISLPTVIWILRTVQDSQAAPSFDYRTFVAYYFPKHFLIQASSFPEIVQFVLVCASGAIALHLLGGAARPWRVAFIGCLALFGVGAILPLVSSSRLLLNLLFLRIDGVIILLSLLLAAAAIAPCLCKGEPWGIGMAVLATSALGDWRATTIALIIFAAERSATSLRVAALWGAAVGLLSVVSQIGTPATFQFQHVLVAVLCFLVAFLEDRPILIALGAVVANINFPILCAGSLVGLCGALLWRQRALYWIVASAGLSAVLQAAFEGVDAKTAVTSVATVGCAAAFLLPGAWIDGFRARFGERTFAIANSFLLLALLVPLLQVAALVWAPPRGTQAMEAQAWKDVQQWARMNTSRDAVFLVPSDSSGFELGSNRQVWIDWQQGAAVMWSPAYYSRWMGRYPEVRKLKSHSDFYQYALAHALGYYVVAKEPDPCDICRGEARIYSNDYFDVYRMPASSN